MLERGLKLAKSSNQFQFDTLDDGGINYFCFSTKLKKTGITRNDVDNFHAMDWNAFTEFEAFIEAANSIRTMTFSPIAN